MSPVSRGRKNAKSRPGEQRVLRRVPDVPVRCDCPECSGEEFDPEAFIADLSAAAAELRTVDDPLEAELFGASLVAIGAPDREDFLEALTEGIVPAVAQLSTPESVAALLAIDAVEGRAQAAAAAQRLTAAGVPAPAWAGELAEPVRVGTCRRYSDSTGETSMLLCLFERSGRSHGFTVHVDHLDCDAAADIMLFPGESLKDIDALVQADAGPAGAALTAAELDPAEFRWQVERALDARAVHDQETDEPDLDDDLDDEDGPGFHVLAALLRARMGELPDPPRPPAPHGGTERPAATLPANSAWNRPATSTRPGSTPPR